MKSDHRRFGVSRKYERPTPCYNYRYDNFAPPLVAVSAGYARWAAGEFYSRAVSDLYGIELITEGNCLFTQDGRQYLVYPGEVYILRLGARHHYETGPAGFLHKRYMALRGAAPEQLLMSLGLAQTDYVRPRSLTGVVRLFKDIHALLVNRTPGFALRLASVTYELLLELSRSIHPEWPMPVRVAVEYMQQNVRSSLTSKDLYAVSGLSQTHFNRLFREHTGYSPMQYFIRQRMAWAQSILEDTEVSIKRVAIMVGYEDPLYFSSQFRKHVGMSPKHFRDSRRASKPDRNDATYT